MTEAAIALPLVSLSASAASVDISSLRVEDAQDCIDAFTRLADGVAHLDATNCAVALLRRHNSRMIPLLELATLCIVCMPYDDTPLHKGAVERAIRAYSTLVGGMYSAQLVSEQQVLDAIVHYRFPLQAVRLYYGTTVPVSPLLPRYRRLQTGVHAEHINGRGCHCTDVVPLCVAFSVPPGYSTPSSAALLGELALATDIDAEIWHRDHTCTLISVADSNVMLFVVWTLVYDSVEELHAGNAAVELRNSWLARLTIYNLVGLPLTSAHDTLQCEFGPGGTRDGHLCECITSAELRARSPQAELHAKLCKVVYEGTERSAPRANYALLYALTTSTTDSTQNAIADAAGNKWRAFSYTQIGLWARYIAVHRMNEWRTNVIKQCRSSAAAFAERMELQQAFALAKRLMYSALFIAMQQSASHEITKMMPTCRSDAHQLWQRRDYREVEDRVRADPRLCVQFFQDLMAGAHVKRSGDTWLQADNHLSFCVAGEQALRWVERGVNHTPEKGRGLGPLVMHCRGQRAADEAYSYVLGWWKAHTSGGSALPPSPSRAIVRVAARSAEEDQQRIAKVLDQCTAVLPGTVAHRYLRETRGLADAPVALIEQNPALRAAARMYFALDDAYALNESNSARWATAPGLVVLSEDAALLQRIYLDAETANKSTSAQPVKRTMGRMVRDAPTNSAAYNTAHVVAPGICVQRVLDKTKPAARLCFVTEGPETALSVAAAWPHSAVYATLGASTLADFEVRDPACTLVICRENDRAETRDALARNVQSALGRLRARAAEVVCVWPPSDAKDFNDVHQRTPGAAGTAEIRQCIERQLLKLSTEWRKCSAKAPDSLP